MRAGANAIHKDTEVKAMSTIFNCLSMYSPSDFNKAGVQSQADLKEAPLLGRGTGPMCASVCEKYYLRVSV